MITGSKVKLSKIVSNHTRLRTDEVIGIVKQIPIVGNVFTMTAEPLDKTKDFRWIETSPIVSIEVKENIWELKTQNSIYQLEVLEY